MGKGKTAQRAARAAAAKVTGPEYVTVKAYESHVKPNGALGLRTTWKKYLKEEWNERWNKKQE